MTGRKIGSAHHDNGLLTDKEYGVVEELVKRGADNVDIGRALSVGDDAIKHHLTNLYDFSGTHNRTELALWWIREGRYEYLNRKAANERR